MSNEMSNKKFERLISKRIILRRFKDSDIEVFWKYRSNSEVAKYQGWEDYTREQSVNFVNEQIKSEPNVPDSWFQMAIELKETGEMIGDCALHTLSDDSRQVEIGYTLDTKYQNKGYATESVFCLLDYVFNVLKKHRVVAITDVRNYSSIKLLERIKMRREGHFIKNIWFKGEWGDEFLYAILEEEWNDKKYQFETERLGFRQWKEEDRIPFAKMNENTEVMKYFPNALTRKQSDEFIDKITNHFNEYGYGLWAVEIKSTKEFIGFIGFHNATFESYFTPCVEIGWRLDNKYWNKGYATEGAKACLKYGFNILGFKDIYSFTSQLNKPSIKVMNKIGLKKQGKFYHPKVDKNNVLRLHVLFKIDNQLYEMKT